MPRLDVASPFGRLALAHGLLVAGDTLVTMALAGSLFFNISPGAARSKVALYLLLTMAPFAVVAPLLGPAIDRSRGGRRAMLLLSAAGRAVLCFFMSDDLNKLLLFPEAFVVLVLSKAYVVAKSALVPSTVTDDDGLVHANSQLALTAVVVGAVAAIPGGLLLKFASGRWVLLLAAVAFAAGAVSALRLPKPVPLPGHEGAEGKAVPAVDAPRGVWLAASAMALLRGTVGFLAFLIAFNFRRDDAPSWWFGVAIAASMIGSLVGTLVAPRVRRVLREERILLAAVASVAVVGLLAALQGGGVWAAAVAGVLGVAAATAKLAFDSIVQRDAEASNHGRSFARFETRFQVAWVAGAFLPVVMPIPLRAGFLLLFVAGAAGAISYAGAGRTAFR
jgi:hypothetical protein